MKDNTCQLKAIIGPGRSGTTWAGSLVDSCPDVIYRFEPFHRLSAVNPEVRQWFEKLKKQAVTEGDLARIYALFRPAHPLTNKAPFFDEKSYSLRTTGRSQLWPLARMLRPAKWLYKTAYSPRPGPPLVFKEVTFIKPLRNLLEQTAIPVVYLVRHPCATVLSSISGPKQGGRPPRVGQLREILQANEPALANRFADVVEGSDIIQRTALLWRFEVETCVSLVRRSARGLVMTYEQLADDTHAEARAMFAHLGIPYGEQTEQFIDSLYGLNAGRQGKPRRTGWGDKHFSVYRNPREQKESWKEKISPDDRRKIEEIAQGGPAIEACAALGRWW